MQLIDLEVTDEDAVEPTEESDEPIPQARSGRLPGAILNAGWLPWRQSVSEGEAAASGRQVTARAVAAARRLRPTP